MINRAVVSVTLSCCLLFISACDSGTADNGALKTTRAASLTEPNVGALLLDQSPIEKIDGAMVYNGYTNYCDPSISYISCTQEQPTNKLRGYSWAGYKGGGVSLPNASNNTTLTTEDLVPDDSSASTENHRIIQEALDTVTASVGAPGAVLLPTGYFYVDEGLKIRRDGVVLRGRGQGENETVIVSVNPRADGEDLNKRGTEPYTDDGNNNEDRQGGAFLTIGVDSDETVADPVRSLSSNSLGITSYPVRSNIKGYVATGALSARVEDTSLFSIGDTVYIVITPNQGMVDDRYPTPESSNGINPSPDTARKTHERVVTKVTAKKLHFDRPLMEPIYPELGSGFVAPVDPVTRIRDVGVEQLRIQSARFAYTTPNDTATRLVKELHTREAILFRYVENAWAKGITCRRLAKTCVGTMEYSKYITVQDAATIDWASMLTGGRRYAFHGGSLSGGSGILFQRIFIRDARHGLVTGKKVPGPVVWLDTLDYLGGESGAHQGNANGLLFDNVISQVLAAYNRAPRIAKHGWTSSQTVFWNSSNIFENHEESTLLLSTPQHSANFVVGGTYINENTDQGGGYIYRGAVPFRSLYLEELESRLGPDAVARVTVPEQHSPGFHQRLRNWRGNGAPPW